MKDLINSVEAVGGQLSTAQITNSIHYLVRRKKMTNLHRGLWATTNAETPADTGVSGSDRSVSDRSLKEGEPDGAGTLRDHDLHPVSRDDDRAHDLRAAMMVAPE